VRREGNNTLLPVMYILMFWLWIIRDYIKITFDIRWRDVLQTFCMYENSRLAWYYAASLGECYPKFRRNIPPCTSTKKLPDQFTIMCCSTLDHEGISLNRDARNHSTWDTASHHRRPQSSASPLCKLQISYECLPYVVGRLGSRTRHRVLAVAALVKGLSTVWWRWHISVSQLCCWSMAVSFWVASITVCICFGVLPRECRSLN